MVDRTKRETGTAIHGVAGCEPAHFIGFGEHDGSFSGLSMAQWTLGGWVETGKGAGAADWARTDLARAELQVVSDVRIGRDWT
jgi:hypothetical protein